MGPDYAKPALNVPQNWNASLPHHGDTNDLVGWWDRFHDPVLTKLLQTAENNSPTLAKAWANIEKSRATVTTSYSNVLPAVTADGSAERQKQALNGAPTATIGNTLSGTLDASWEIDLFGKNRREIEAADARAQENVANWHDARVSLAAEVADDYVQYVACHRLATNERQIADSQRETARITSLSVKAGLTSEADGFLVDATAETKEASATEQQASCEILVKALVDVTGMEEASLRVLLDAASFDLSKPESFSVDTIPANILTRRPDIVAMERELAATNAEIGSAVADQYPSLSLTGNISRSGVNLNSLMTTWLFGPSISLPMLDWGKKSAAVDSARATYDAQLATYKQGLRTAIKEVEQALVRLDSATKRSGNARVAADKYTRIEESTEAYWKAGGVSLLKKEEAKRNALSARSTAVTTERDQIEYWIALYKAVGGGWMADTSILPQQTSSATMMGDQQ